MVMRSSSNPNLSDDSHIDMDVDLTPEMRQYRKKYQLLLERCEIIQQDNERIVHRIQKIKKMTKCYKRDVKLLMRELDKHGDEWRTAEDEVDLKPDDLIIKREIKREKNDKLSKSNNKSNSKKKTGTRKKIKTEKDKDPNAPKRPPNAFFLFCQEQRPIAMQKLAAFSQNEPNKQELTRHLALLWRNLPPDEKQIYIERYEISKEKYDEKMSAYIKKE
ncbi:high mobility group protein B1-like [Ctenocephalides felis]|uniref:high mobility group protein B1-like n=1 Tax=Ctenocephalides felis TaxID=7515 RepID=UPI000E6E1C5C|nr:high mobility group protein B1-like [Ctenocephalides felis]XP_026469341.1 high mobility group protein B1-like [Ctenocephalides felis]